MADIAKDSGVLVISGTDMSADMASVTVRENGSNDVLYVDQTDVSDGNYAFSAFVGRNIGISVQIGKSVSTSEIRFFGEKREERLCVGIGKRCLRRHSTKTF